MLQACLKLWSGKTHTPSTGLDRGQTSSLSPVRSPRSAPDQPHNVLPVPTQPRAQRDSTLKATRGDATPELYYWNRKGFSRQKPGTPASNLTLASPADLSQPLQRSSASSLQIRKLRLREASHHPRSPSLQAVQSLGPCLPRSWGGGHGPRGGQTIWDPQAGEGQQPL